MFLARIENQDAFFAAIAGRTYERFHYGPWPQFEAPSVFYPIARTLDGQCVFQCTLPFAEGDIRWPLEGSIALTDWGW